MGASSSGGRQDGNQMNSTVFNKVGVGRINEKGQSLEKDAFRNRGKDSINKIKTPATIILGPALKAGTVVNRDFFTDKVLGSKNYKGTTKQDFDKMTARQQDDMYSSYMSGRQSGKTDAYGNAINAGNDNNTPRPTILKKTAGGQTVQTTSPTEAEVSQSAAADAEATQYDERVTKKRGRSKNILTSKQGVMKTSADYSLGKKSLLGQVV